MTLFRFHIDDGAERTNDNFGVELETLRAARIEAAVLAGELLRDRPDEFWDTQSWTMTVEDEAGLTLFVIHIAATAAPAMMLQFRR
jgi:hypothetical protein